MRFHDGSVDLIKTFQAFDKRYGSKPVSRTSFGLPVVRMAESLLGGHGADPIALPGIHKSLLYLTIRLSWYEFIWIFPRPPRKQLFQVGPFGYVVDDKATMLVDSLMLTVMEYRQGLRDYPSNLAYLLFSDLLMGFERLCDWVERGVPLEANKNDIIVPIEIARLTQQLHLTP
jgi:hypothetical protein